MDVRTKHKLTLLELSSDKCGIISCFGVYVSPVNKWVLIAINFIECNFFAGMRLFVIYFAIILFHMSSK